MTVEASLKSAAVTPRTVWFAAHIVAHAARIAVVSHAHSVMMVVMMHSGLHVVLVVRPHHKIRTTASRHSPALTMSASVHKLLHYHLLFSNPPITVWSQIIHP